MAAAVCRRRRYHGSTKAPSTEGAFLLRRGETLKLIAVEVSTGPDIAQQGNDASGGGPNAARESM
jgi:hypothetical protein